MAQFPRWQYVPKGLINPNIQPREARLQEQSNKELYASGAYTSRYNTPLYTYNIGNTLNNDHERIQAQKLTESRMASAQRYNDYIHNYTYGGQYPGGRPDWKGESIADDGPIHLGVSDIHKHFRGISVQELSSGRFSRPVSFLDIETGHNDQPISVSALKGVIDKRTGEFRVINALEKYYTPKNASSSSFALTREVHGLTPSKIAALRGAQQAVYNSTFDEIEKKDLMNFLKGSLIAGHNIEEFDIERLGLASLLQSQNVLDTQVLAENIGIRRGQRGLEPLFKKFTGRSSKRAGYSHHVSFHDVMMNAELLSSLWKMGGRAGRDLHYVISHQGFSYGKYEPVAGTSLIKGGYFKGRGPRGLEAYMYEDEFDENGVFEYEYDENGRRILPDGYGLDEGDASTEDWLNYLGEEGGDSRSMSMAWFKGLHLGQSIGSTYASLEKELQKVREASAGYTFSTERALQRTLAGMDERSADEWLKRNGYTEKQRKKLYEQTQPLRIAKWKERDRRKLSNQHYQYQSISSYLDHLSRMGDIDIGDYNWLSQVAHTEGEGGFSPQDLKYMAKESVIKHRERQHKIADKQREEQEQASFEDIKERKIRKLRRHDKLMGVDDETLIRSAKSFEELEEAIDKVTTANEKQMAVLEKIGKIKMYDMNQYIGAAKDQWGGITKAARGLVPSFVLAPIQRLGDAAFNAVDRSMSPWNAFNRTWNSGIGPALMGALGAGMGPVGLGVGMAINGGVNAITQIAGNSAQARMEMAGLNIQNNLNTLGAITSYITTPFQLLYKATKTLTGGFLGLTKGISSLISGLKGIMVGGIGVMASLGNPLSELTNVNYGAYEGTRLMDVASLFGKGTVNSMIEDFANQQKAFYTLGQVDTNRLISSSLLGVYGDVYNPEADTKSQFFRMANTILNTMKTQSPEQQARTMYLSSLINKDLPSLLHTANLLDIQDVQQLSNPSAFHYMYWRPLSEGENKSFRRTQYEYGAATTQFGYSKMRLANMLWNGWGRDIYNAFNEVVDRLGRGDWKGVLNAIVGEWDKLKVKLKGVWEDVNSKYDITGHLKEGFNKSLGVIKEWGVKAASMILSVWNSIVLAIADKLQGLIAYLSTIQIKPVWNWDTKKLEFEFSSIDTAPGYEDVKNKKVYEGIYSNTGLLQGYKPGEGMKALAAVADIVWADKDKYWRTADPRATVHQLYKDTESWLALGKDLNIPGYNIPGVDIHTTEGKLALFDALAKAGSEGAGMRDVAAWYKSKAPDRWKVSGYANSTGIADAAQKFVTEVTAMTMGALAGDDTTRLEITFRDKTGRQTKMITENGAIIESPDFILLQQMIPNGLALDVNGAS